MPDLKKAELINGVVYMGSPVRADVHGEADTIMKGWILVYSAHTPGTRGAGNSTR